MLSKKIVLAHIEMIFTSLKIASCFFQQRLNEFVSPHAQNQQYVYSIIIKT